VCRTVLSLNDALSSLKKFCGRCKKELPAESKYLLCEKCHKRVVTSEDDQEFYENSRLHY
jgi:predicted amidophosphoribosyltransferase